MRQCVVTGRSDRKPDNSYMNGVACYSFSLLVEVVGDAHTNTCENRHSFLRQWLAKFRGVSKHHLQKYLCLLALKPNSPNDWFEKLLCYNVSE